MVMTLIMSFRDVPMCPSITSVCRQALIGKASISP
jgi:hypothetical protein